MRIAEVLRRLRLFESDANSLLAQYETSKARVFVLEKSYRQLGKLTLEQDDLLRQALRSIEHELYRSAFVMAWAAFMDFIENRLAEDSFVALNEAFPKMNVKNISDLRDKVSDFDQVGAMRQVGFCSKIEEKGLKGMLSRRNESAHPSTFYPGQNEALGFVSETLQRIRTLRDRKRR